MTLTAERLREVLDYDPVTGVFSRGGQRAGTIDHDGYLRIQIGRQKYRAHRLAWFYVHGVWPSNQIDHKDRNRLNNAIRNLEDKPQSLNGVNRTVFKTSKTGVKGVTFEARKNRYRAYTRVDGRRICLGYYLTSDEAAEAYRKFAENRHDNHRKGDHGQHLGSVHSSHDDGVDVPEVHPR